MLTCLILVAGCGGAPAVDPAAEEPEPPEATETFQSISLANIDESEFRTPRVLQKAELDLALVIESGAEWMVHEASISDEPVSLSELLAAARDRFDNGNPEDGKRLARLVSEFAGLALAQQSLNRHALPSYPDAE